MSRTHYIKPRNRIAALLICATLTAAPLAWAQKKAAPSGNAQLVDAIIVVVNDEVITRQELAARILNFEQRMKNQKVALPPPEALRHQILERMIVERAQIQLSKEMGIRVDDTMLDRAVSRIAEQNKMSLQEFRNQIEREGTPFPRFREEIRDEIVMQRLREREVDNKIQISDSDIDNFLLLEAASAANQQEYNLAQILVRIPENASPEQIASRRARADDLFNQLKSGANFAKIAASHSDSSDALKGGEIGWRNPERLPQLFVDAAAGLKPGDISAPIKSANGFHIIKMIDKRSAASAKVGGASVQQTHARHILIKVNQLVTSYDAKRKLLELKERLDNKAAKFEELARTFSNDGSASKGGDLGWLYPGDTLPEFEQAMNALKPGEISDAIETSYGFHLIEVIERKTDDVSKERQRMAARMALRERKSEEAYDDWLRQLRDRAYVEFRTEDK